MGKNGYFIEPALASIRYEQDMFLDLKDRTERQRKLVKGRVAYLREICDADERVAVEQKLIDMGVTAPPKQVMQTSLVEKAETQSSGRAERISKRKK